MYCRAKTTDVKVSDEHDEFIWINPDDRGDYNVMEPDDKVVDELVTLDAD